MGPNDAVWIGQYVAPVASLALPAVTLEQLFGADGASDLVAADPEIPAAGWQVVVAPPAAGGDVVLAAPVVRRAATGWMTLDVRRVHGRWCVADRRVDPRAIEPYVPPADRWPHAAPLFGVAWRIEELTSSEDGRPLAPSRLARLTLRPDREGIVASVGRSSPLARCEVHPATQLFFHPWVTNLMWGAPVLDPDQDAVLFAVLRGEVDWAVHRNDRSRVEFRSATAGVVRAVREEIVDACGTKCS